MVGIRRTDGTRRWLEIDVRHIDDPVDGNLLVTSFRDVTQQKEGQDRMRVLSAIVDSSSDAITSGSIDGTIESWNDGAQALYGYTADEMIGRSLEVIVPADAELELEHLFLAVRGGKSINNLLTTRLHKDGTRVPVALTASPIRDADGEIKSIAVIERGVRELVAARDALIEAEERFRSLVQRSSDVAFVFDPDGMITYASPAVTRYGYRWKTSSGDRVSTSSTPTTSSTGAPSCGVPSSAMSPRASNGGSAPPTARGAGSRRPSPT